LGETDFGPQTQKDKAAESRLSDFAVLQPGKKLKFSDKPRL